MSEVAVNPTALPSSWTLTTLGAVVSYGRTRKVEPNEIANGDWVLELEDVEKDSSRLLQKMTFLQRQSKSTKNRFEAGDVLYGKLRPYLNKVLIADEPGYCTTEILPLRAGTNLDNRYLFYWLKHPAFLKYVEAESHGMNMPRLGTAAGRAAPFVLAPKNEQTRIANQLDTLIKRIQSCRDRLEAIPHLLKRFRQVIANFATDGQLSGDWRKYAAPELWKSVRLEEVCDSITDGDHQAPEQTESGIPFITISAIDDGELRLEKATRYVSTAYFDALKSTRKPARGDILFSVTGSIGISALVNTDELFTFQRHIAILKVDLKLILNKYLILVLRSDSIREQVLSVATGTAQLTVPLGGVRSFSIPLPPLNEQAEIVRRAEALFDFADRIETLTTSARTRAQRLGPLVLVKAFRGELVAHDPSEQTATQLLTMLTTELSGAAKKKQVPRSVKPRVQSSMKNSDKEAIKLAILTLKPGSYFFEELKMEVNGDYELVKTALFELLQSTNPRIKQVFDEKLGSMKLLRVKP